jgi:hypothetical protein
VKLFECDACHQVAFFESTRCEHCGRALAFLPEVGLMSALGETGARPGYHPCRNDTEHGVCNWAVREGEGEYCRSCRLTRTIPNLADDKAKQEWHRLELAKRRLLYTLFALKLPVESKAENPEGGIAFDFLADAADAKVFTGHTDGLVTINVAEADNPFREKIRERLGETYRTVLGHLRHESGHYYWERLVANSPALPAFRALFGDEQVSYEDAMKRHYEQGPPPNWWDRYVSSYATMHPWEDWAESWAHYLHMVDGLETARAYKLSLRPSRGGGDSNIDAARVDPNAFDDLIAGWIPLTIALNNMNRSFGMADCYPFVLTEQAIVKLRFVHGCVHDRTHDAANATKIRAAG